MCNLRVRDVAPAIWAGSASAVPYMGPEAWLTASHDGILKPVLGWYTACDRHGTADPTTHRTRAEARHWTCPHDQEDN